MPATRADAAYNAGVTCTWSAAGESPGCIPDPLSLSVSPADLTAYLTATADTAECEKLQEQNSGCSEGALPPAQDCMAPTLHSHALRTVALYWEDLLMEQICQLDARIFIAGAMQTPTHARLYPSRAILTTLYVPLWTTNGLRKRSTWILWTLGRHANRAQEMNVSRQQWISSR